MELETRSQSGIQTTVPRVIEGYALRFDSLSNDLGKFRETISPHALDDTDLSNVLCLVNHDFDQVIGRTSANTLDLKVDEKGLYFRCQLPNTSYANDLYELVSRGDIRNCSFRFAVPDKPKGDSFERRDGGYIRSVNKISELLEISIVSIPAYKETSVEVAQRSLQQAIQENERTELALELELLNL